MKQAWEKIKQFLGKINRKTWIMIAIGLFAVAIMMTIWIILDIAENQRIDAEAIIFRDNLSTSYGSEVKVSDFLENVNGELVEDVTINTSQLGEQTVKFEYINIKNKKRQREFTVNIIDTVTPTIYGNKTYIVPVNYGGKLTDLMLSFDDLDDHPLREITGDYDLSTPGKYELEYIITDNYHNSTVQPFTLQVVKPSNDTPEPYVPEKPPIAEVIKTHKTKNTKIGIDVSSWQGEIDWEKVKAAGVEFAFIRVGYQLDYDTEFILDKYFQANITGAAEVGLPVGVYFYTYANTVEAAEDQANWIMEQIGDYPAELGIAFDWEDWADFNNASMSLHTVQQVARRFIETAEAHGYTGLLYSSKVYLDRIWQPAPWLPENAKVWLAQYYDYATYTGKYHYWQLSSSGTVPGIKGNVDLDIMYLEPVNEE